MIDREQSVRKLIIEKERLFRRIISIILFLTSTGLFILSWGGLGIRRARFIKNFSQTDALVTKSDVRKYADSGKYEINVKYKIYLEYVYTLDKEYKSNYVLDTSNVALASFYAPGQKIKLYYDENNPKDNVFSKERDAFIPVITLFLGSVIFLLSLLLIYLNYLELRRINLKLYY